MKGENTDCEDFEEKESRNYEENRVKTYTVRKIVCLVLSVLPLYVILFLPLKIITGLDFPMLTGACIMAVAFFVVLGLLLIKKSKARIEKLAAEGNAVEAIDLSEKSKKNYLNIMIVLWIVGILLAINLPSMMSYTNG